MAFAYTIKDQGAPHFITFTVHQWVDVFTRNDYAQILIDNLKYCQISKGLEIYGWVIMSNHMHLIIRAKNDNLSDIIRDFKKHTAKVIFDTIKNNPSESRKRWLGLTLSFDGRINFWQEGYHGVEITSKEIFYSKLDYIHANPVKAGLVEKQEDYLLSSAGLLYGIRKGFLDLSIF